MSTNAISNFKTSFASRGIAVRLAAVLLLSSLGASPARPQTPASSPEAHMWEVIRDTSDPQVLDRFIAAFPASPFAARARERKAELASRWGHAAPGTRIVRAVPVEPAQDAVSLSPEPLAKQNNQLSPRANSAYFPPPRPVPVKPVQNATRLSPEPLAQQNNQLSSGGSSGYPGYFPAPRAVTAIPMPPLPPPGAAKGQSPVLTNAAAHLLIFTPGNSQVSRTSAGISWTQIENSNTVRAFHASAAFAGTGWHIAWQYRILRPAPPGILMILRATLDYRGPQPAPRVERMLPPQIRAAKAQESTTLLGNARRVSERVFEFDVSAGEQALHNLEAILSANWLTAGFMLGDGREMTTMIGNAGLAGTAMASALAWARVKASFGSVQ